MLSAVQSKVLFFIKILLINEQYWSKINMTYCIKECRKYKAAKPSQIGRYAAGQKRCNYCEIFVDYTGITCPCCNRQLRCLPRSRKGKEKYLEQIVR